MSASISIVEDAVLTVLRTFLLAILPGATDTPPTIEVVTGQINRVPEPDSDNYVVMTPIMRTRLATDVDIFQDSAGATGNPSGVRQTTTDTQITVQLDFHGPFSGDNAQIFTTLFRNEYAVDQFSASIIENGWLLSGFGVPITDGTNSINITTTGACVSPLYTSEPRQVPFINGEDQYEYRWSVDAEMQINPTITTPQGFAATLGPLTLIEVIN